MDERRSFRFPKGLEDLIFPVADRFLSMKYTTEQIADWVTGELAARQVRVAFTRQQVYPVVGEAVRRGYVKFCPPLNVHFAQRIADRNQTGIENVRVVNAWGPEGLDSVAASAAELTLALIRRRALKRRRSRKHKVAIHLGLGAGHTAMLVSRRLGQLLRSTPEIEGVSKLVLHAMSSGFTYDRPLSSPVAFFSYFLESIIPVEYIGLFSAPVEYCSEYERVKNLPGVKQALGRAREIDIVITSLGNARDKYGLLVRIEDEFYGGRRRPKPTPGVPRRVGDVQFRPYSNQGPIPDDPRGIRAVTLFELRDFVHMAAQGRYVILVSGTQPNDRTKARALLPLLKRPNLRVWSHLCLDLETAREVVALQERRPGRGAAETA